MTITDFENSSDVDSECPCQFFVRIENLPWFATPKDVTSIFYGLNITPGGISILGRNAFVSFERWEDMSLALRRDVCVLHGQKLFLSVVDLKKVREINDHHIQRSLHSLSLIGKRRKNVTETDSEALNTHKKIRPTTIIAGNADHNISSSVFVPKEIDSDFFAVRAMPVAKPDTYRCRRIKPTPLRKSYSVSVFSPSPFQIDENWNRLIYG